jgi:DNA invertase Pin-like site-specific DNA recombinase
MVVLRLEAEDEMATNGPRAIGYIRRSSRVNLEPGMSWELQVNAIHALAARYGVEDLELLWDWGKSGGAEKRHLRAGWAELHHRLETGSVQLIFGYAADRMARSLLDLLTFYRACEAAGAKVVYHDGGEQDFRTPEGKLRLQVMGSVAEFQRAQTVEKAKAMHRIRRARGERVGRAPYGSREGDRADLVVVAFREVGSFTGTARRLNEWGVPSFLGRLWRSSAVEAVLRREAPELIPPTARARSRPVSRFGFTFYHLLRDSSGHILTATHDHGAVVYRCGQGEVDPTHPRPTGVSQRRILPWAMAEAARLRLPTELAEVREHDEARRTELAGKRERWLEMYAEGILDKAARDRRLAEIDAALDALDASTTLVEIPAIDWSWEPKTLNNVLTALWSYIQLDERMRPTEAIWRVPEWRDPDDPRDRP